MDDARPPRPVALPPCVNLSGAGWSESPVQGHAGERAIPSASSTQLQVGYEERYEEEYVLGQGGMGVVQAVLDHRLGRRLALKRTRQPDALLEARLRREIRILASLQHPGIVPLLEAGADAKGRPWYTMPKLPGRTLDEELAARKTRRERFGLLRPMLAVCQAVAHAHEKGFVHRDLKPANVIVGGRGQTFVLDWGLARWADEPEDAPLELREYSPIVSESDELTAFGQVLGTPRYMSPEQARGELAERPSDVYALGTMLYALAYGRDLPVEDGALPASAFELVDDDPPPPAFVAVLRKCLAYDATARYADAGELALELERFLDGRRVQAHAYSRAELFARFVDEHRVALGVAAFAALSISLLGVMSYFQIRSESQRARSAETRTRNALARSEASESQARSALALSDQRLREALVGQARSARSVGAHPEAERFALEALALGPSPEAHGVLAAVTGQASASRELGPELPVCDASAFTPGGESLLCHRRRGLSVHDMKGPARRVAADSIGGFSALDPEHFLVAHDDRTTSVHRLDDLGKLAHIQAPSIGVSMAARNQAGKRVYGGYGVHWWTWSTSEGLRHSQPGVIAAYCGAMGSPQGLVMSRDRDRDAWGRCSNGNLFRIEVTPEGPKLVASADQTSTVTRVAIGTGASADILFVAAQPGEVLYFDAEDLTPRPGLETQLGRIRDIEVHPEGDWVVLRDDFGRVEIRSVFERDRKLRLPGSQAQAIAFDPQGRLLVARDRLERWTLPAALPLRVWHSDAGLSSVALSPDDAWMATTNGSGFVSLWSPAESSPRWRQRWQKGVAKDCAFAPDGRRLACSTMEGGARLWRVPDPTAEPAAGLPEGAHRRVAWLGSELWSFPYSRRVNRWLGPDRVIDAGGEDGDWKDVGSAPKGQALVRLNAHDGSIRVETRQKDGAVAGAVLARRPGALAVDLGPEGEVAVVGPGPRIELIEADGRSRFEFDSPLASRLLDVEISADGQLVAAGTLRGEILVWDRAGKLLARLEGHEQRVVKLAISSDSRFLLSASWDESVRRWELSALGAPVGELPEAQWELSLDEAMRVPGI